MKKPVLNDYGLTEEQYLYEKKKDEKVGFNFLYIFVFLMFCCNVYYVLLRDFTFAPGWLGDILLLNLIGGIILMTWLIGIILIISTIYNWVKSKFFPHFSFVQHNKKYEQYIKAIDKYKKDLTSQQQQQIIIHYLASPKDKYYTKVVNAYGKTIGDVMKEVEFEYLGLLYPESLLPYPKEVIHQAIEYTLQHTTDESDKNALYYGQSILKNFVADIKAKEAHELVTRSLTPDAKLLLETLKSK